MFVGCCLRRTTVRADRSFRDLGGKRHLDGYTGSDSHLNPNQHSNRDAYRYASSHIHACAYQYLSTH
jgi:hypothetical protein